MPSHCVSAAKPIHSTGDGELGRFQLLATASRAAIIVLVSRCDTFDEKTKMKKNQEDIRAFLIPPKVQMVTIQSRNPG